MPAGLRTLLAPRLWGLHAVAVLAITAALLLGLWQYDAWHSRRDDEAGARADATPRPLATVISADQPFPGDAVGRPVAFSGRWLPRSTLYVADRDLAGRRGVWVVTPVAVCTESADCPQAPAMLVVRGWAASVQEAPAAPRGEVRVTGWLQPGEGAGVPDPDPADDVLPEMRIASALQHVDQDLYGGYVVAARASTGSTGLEPVTPASLPQVDTFTALRNLLYAIEWWLFGGFAVFLWVRWCRDEIARSRLVEEAVAGPGEDDPAQDGVSGVTGVPSSP